jgi:hypothetical protein
MTAFIITMLVLHLINLGINMNDLTTRVYPYTKTRDKMDDVVSLLVCLGFAVWAGFLIF